MTLNQLLYFCTAARFHSITKAANNLMVTQPAVSIAIKELEKEISINLFHHSGNRLILTEEGEGFYLKATQILSDCEELKMEYIGKSSIRSHVRLGIPPLLSTIFFPEMLDSFHVDHPEAGWNCMNMAQSAHVNWFRTKYLISALPILNFRMSINMK
ncbi:MAG: LysR family transcriptional regulator [Blautia sp.]|nr:LysR family transcriptional regulator [Blautia sp.]